MLAWPIRMPQCSSSGLEHGVPRESGLDLGARHARPRPARVALRAHARLLPRRSLPPTDAPKDLFWLDRLCDKCDLVQACRGPSPCMHLACCACSASVSPAAPHLRRFRVTEASRRGSAGCHPSCHPSANRRRLKRLSAPWNRHFFGDRNARAKSQTGATSCGSAD